MTVSGNASNPIDDLDWLTVRYVLDELSPEQATAFEERLAHDQSARDALVRATQLVATLAPAASPERIARPHRRGVLWRTLAVLTATAAVVLIGVADWRSAERGGAEKDQSPPTIALEIDPARLVVLWSASATTLPDAPAGEPADDLSQLDDTDGDFLPPEWMLLAVRQDSASNAIDSSLDEDGATERN